LIELCPRSEQARDLAHLAVADELGDPRRRERVPGVLGRHGRVGIVGHVGQMSETGQEGGIRHLAEAETFSIERGVSHVTCLGPDSRTHQTRARTDPGDRLEEDEVGGVGERNGRDEVEIKGRVEDRDRDGEVGGVGQVVREDEAREEDDRNAHNVDQNINL